MLPPPERSRRAIERDSMLASRVFWLLLASAVVSAAVRTSLRRADPADLREEELFTYEQSFVIHASPGDFRLLSYIPQPSKRARLLDERFETGSLTMDLSEDEHGRHVTLRGAVSGEGTRVAYRTTVSSRAVRYRLDPSLAWTDVPVGDDTTLRPTESIQVGDEHILDVLAQILDLGPWLEQLEPELPGAAAWRTELARRAVGPVPVLEAVFDYCQNTIHPATFSGATDALTALSLGEASCGGKSRLMAALTRSAGIPTRMVGGVILGDGKRKRTSHVWVECRIAGEWVPFDPLNDYFANLPGHFLTLYRGDVPLIEHSRGLAFDYAFASHVEHVPRRWMKDMATAHDAARGAALVPLLRRQQFTIILLAPFALLLTVFLRQVVGLESMGVFLPVLLGFSISQTGWIVGGGQLFLAIVIGVSLRILMSRLNLLHVPRTAVMITFLVVLFLLFSVLLEAAGLVRDAGSVILPMAALAMTVERYTTTALDGGHRGALAMLGQTFLLAAGCYVVLTTGFFKTLTITFPEVFLVIVALIVMVGNYRGLRLRELWRFRSVAGVSS
jgi:hypothetical protein